MITVIDLQTLREAFPPGQTVLVLGNFDGVHLGHKQLIDAAILQKKHLSSLHPNLSCGAFFFRNSPSECLTGVSTPQITTLEEKLSLFSKAGLDYAFVADFPSMKDLDSGSFVRDILMGQCRCVYAVCGYNFSFGKKAEGNAKTLFTLMKGNAQIVDCVKKDSVPISSSRIREYLLGGDMEAARTMLGHTYSFQSSVIHGKHLGNKLGFPTINQNFPLRLLIPKQGIYATAVTISGQRYPAVTNIGVRPTVDQNGEINCETHILGFEGDLYGQNVAVEFLSFLREEKKFASVNELVFQIRQDAILANQIFNKNNM